MLHFRVKMSKMTISLFSHQSVILFKVMVHFVLSVSIFRSNTSQNTGGLIIKNN